MFSQFELYFRGVQRESSTSYNFVTIGDLHSHPIKLLYSLIRNKILDMSDKQYHQLIHCYLSIRHHFNPQTIQALFHQFSTILNQAQVINKPNFIIMGNELASQGLNDWFILLILKKLHDHQVPYKILMSSSSLSFLYLYTCWKNNIKPRLDIFDIAEDNSFSKLIACAELKNLDEQPVILRSTLEKLVDSCYIPHLHLIEFSFDKHLESISLYCAPARELNDVKAIIYALGFPNKAESIQDTLMHLEQSQIMFKKHFLPTLLESLNELVLTNKINQKKQLVIKHVCQILNGQYHYADEKNYTNLKMNDYQLVSLHSEPNQHRINLSNSLGNNLYNSFGEFREFRTYDHPHYFFKQSFILRQNPIIQALHKIGPYLGVLVMGYLLNKHGNSLSKTLNHFYFRFSEYFLKQLHSNPSLFYLNFKP